VDFETILVERRDAVACVTLNRPERANTISVQLMRDMLAAFEALESDPSCRVVIITGAGERHFCGGADLKDPALRARRAEDMPKRDFITAIEDSRLPVIAAINGAAMGGGCEIALACDFRVIADDAQIGLPEIRFGALPAGGGTQRLPRLVGPGVAKEMILLGLPWTPADALRVGLVHRVAPKAELMKACEEIAAVLVERAAYAVRTAKRLVNKAVELPLAEGLKFERQSIGAMATAEERAEEQKRAAASQATYARIFGQSS
jgi:enoyl-CoA hydratase